MSPDEPFAISANGRVIRARMQVYAHGQLRTVLAIHGEGQDKFLLLTGYTQAYPDYAVVPDKESSFMQPHEWVRALQAC